MRNANLNLIRPLYQNQYYPTIRFALGFNGMSYDWAIDHDIAAQLRDYIKKPDHRCVTADEGAKFPVDQLRMSGKLQGQLDHSGEFWFAEQYENITANGFGRSKIEVGRLRYVFASAAITNQLWWDIATEPEVDLPDRLKEYVSSHEEVLRFSGGIELVMADFITPENEEAESALIEKSRGRFAHPTRRRSRFRYFSSSHGR